MTKVIVVGVAFIVLVQAFAVTQLDRELVVACSGAALAAVVLAVQRRLKHRGDPAEEAVDDPGSALRRWVSRTETQISWADSTRSDWDRRLRPMLARQFELAAGQRKAKDPEVFDATGRMLFGDRLWPWVDPDNVARSGDLQPGPGRAVLHDILERLEQL